MFLKLNGSQDFFGDQPTEKYALYQRKYGKMNNILI